MESIQNNSQSQDEIYMLKRERDAKVAYNQELMNKID